MQSLFGLFGDQPTNVVTVTEDNDDDKNKANLCRRCVSGMNEIIEGKKVGFGKP